MAALAKLADLKTLAGITVSTHDTLLTTMLERASADADRLVGRPLLRETVTEYPLGDRACMLLTLTRQPIESVTSVKQLYETSTDAQFLTEDALEADEDYWVDTAAGRLHRIAGVWAPYPRWLQVVYIAGYIDPATAEIPTGAITPPKDIQHGVLCQALAHYRRRDTAGLNSAQLGGGVSVDPLSDADHPALVAACGALRRLYA